MKRQPFHIAVAAGYMPFFNEIMPEGYPAERDAYGKSLADIAGGAGRITYLGLVDSEAGGAAAGERLAGLDADALLLAPTMATPANYLWNVAKARKDIPVVIWSAHETGSVAPDYDMVELCRHSQNVGTLMVGNMLSRAGRPFTVVAGEREDTQVQAELVDTLRVAALAGRLRKARIGRLGRPLEGYANVDADEDALKAATGIEIVDVELDEWNAELSATGEAATAATLAEVASRAALDESDGSEGKAALNAAGRMAAALTTIAERRGFLAGALNCRGAYGVTSTVSPSLGCLAVTHAAGLGIPFSCTGDVITAIAMAIGSELGGATLYCELDAIDTGKDAFLCANTGEGDYGWSQTAADCRVFASRSDSGRHAPGCSVRQVLRPGPATMIGFTPRAEARNGFALIAMEGEVLERPDVALSVSSAWFRADTRPMRQAFARWAEAGATHHASLTPGRQADRLALLARFMGIGFERA